MLDGRAVLVFLVVALASACSSGSSVRTVEFAERDLTQIEGSATRTVEHSPPLGKGMTMVLNLRFGDIEIETREGTKPSLTARMKIQAETDGGAASALKGYEVVSGLTPEGLETRVVGEPITVIRADGLSTTLYPTVDLEVVVPPGTPVILRTESGDVRAEGSFGAAALKSKMGNLSISGANGDLRVETDSGEIEVRNANAPTCRLVTKLGKIEAEGAFRVLELQTDSGDVELLVNPGSKVLMPWKVETAFGNIVVAIPEDLVLMLTATSAFGRVSSEVPFTGRSDGVLKTLHVTQGKDGKKVGVHTQSGEVRVRRR